MVDDLRELARRLERLARAEGTVAIGEHLADVWVDTSQQVMGKDTRQLEARTDIRSFASTSGGAVDARLQADTPYAGFHNYGSRFQAPNRFWDRGLEAAEAEARQLGGRVGTSIERALSSGGVWNPRNL